MIKPERMSKLFLVGPKTKLNKVVAKLHDLKIAHIIEHKKDDKFDICPPQDYFEKISSLLVQTSSIMSHLNIQITDTEKKEMSLSIVKKELESIKDETTGILDEISSASDAKSSIAEQKNILALLSLLNLSPQDFKQSKFINSYFGYVANPINIEQLKNITENFEILTKEHNKKILVAVFVESKFAAKIEEALNAASFSGINVDSIKELTGNPNNLIEELSKKQEKLSITISNKKDTIKKLAGKHAPFLLSAEKYLAIETEKAQIPLNFGSTKETFFLKCFLPTKIVQNTKDELIKAAGNKLHVTDEEISETEEIPIKIENKGLVKPFEFFTNLYSLPKYDEFDPTILMAFTFPLFFGFMLGDVGYGLITFALFYYLKKKFPNGKDFFNILMISSVGAMIFGFIYGEFFGFEPYHGLIVRTHDINTLMIISIIAGTVQVNFGLILGFILEFKHHGFLKAAYEKLSWILIQISAALIYISSVNIVNIPVYIGYILLAFAIFMLYKGEGFMGVIEIPSIVSQIVSYARLMAVGLASVFIAIMVNDFTTFLFHKGILFIPLAVIALIVGHTFNIALGILSPSLHSIRLHYVEFFTKFYTGGGIEYAPFGAEKQKSII